MNVPTPHIAAAKGEIAKKVLMPGDPLRAKYAAETYLDNVRCVNQIRNMFAYTGSYHGEPVTIMGSGMGMPSIAIYSYELFNFYDVDEIIRIGSAGSYSDDLKMKDVVIAQAVCYDSNYMDQYKLPGTYAPIADFNLIMKAVKAGEALGANVVVGNVLSSDIYYNAIADVNERWKRMGVLCVEMESAALYANAAYAGKKALGIFSISNNVFTGEELPVEERETGFNNMIKIALEV